LEDAFRDDVVKEQVVKLAEYCYEDVRPEGLMELVQRYIAFKLPHLWGGAGLRRLSGIRGSCQTYFMIVLFDLDYES